MSGRKHAMSFSDEALPRKGAVIRLAAGRDAQLQKAHLPRQKSSELWLQLRVLVHHYWYLLTLDHSPKTSWGGQSTFAHTLLVGNLGSWQVSSGCLRKLPSVSSCLQDTLRVWIPPPQVREHWGGEELNTAFTPAWTAVLLKNDIYFQWKIK